MNDYVLLYSGGGMAETEDEQKSVMQDWETWMGKLGSALVDGGNPFTPAAKKIAADGSISDGPVDQMASGYSVIKAESLEEAAALAKDCPVLKGGASISVFETFDATAM